MPSAKRASDAEGRKLANAVAISRQFLRSVRIDADFGREDALSGYVCQGTARALLESMARQLTDTKQRAFTWTGPYGGGKSSLALMLCSLVGPNGTLRDKAKEMLDLASNSRVHRAFEAQGRGWLVVPVVGKRTSAAAEIAAALALAKGEPYTQGKRKRGDTVAALVAAANRHRQGVLLVIDELGKFLEVSAQDGGDDIYFFQELAEAASRAAGKLVVVGILHQAFEAYASRLGRDARDEWAKVQGRFIDVPLVSATDEVIELIGRAIDVDRALDRKQAKAFVDVVANAIRSRRPGTPTGIADGLLRCWPLHPVTAAMLGPISKRRFGQNERSTFGFLASREPLGFVEFLEAEPAKWQSMYGPARFWDYLKANLEPAIMASPDAHRWAIASEAVERAEAKGEPHHVELTKVVALIEMFRNGSGVVPEAEILAVSVQGMRPDQVGDVLKQLVAWKILIERKHLGAYGVYAGSDFDIEGAVNQARGEIGEPSIEHISALSDLQPILAKRLYQQTGTMRWMTRRIVGIDDIERALDRFVPDKGSLGSFVLCLPNADHTEKAADARMRRISLEYGDVPAMVGVPANAKRVAELSLELAALERVSRGRPELEGDSVARRELIGRVASVRAFLEEELADAFSLCKWYFRGELQSTDRSASLSAIASSVGASLYSKAPWIFSELINREDPSSNSIKARKELMYRMVSHADQPKLGYEGMPADAGLYYNVVHEPGLHAQRRAEGWSFGPPNMSERGQSMEGFWYDSHNLVTERHKEVTLSELYELWAAPPFGVRAGAMPVLALAFYMAHQSSLAMYIDGVFTPEMSEAAVDEWLQNPRQVRFQFVAASEDHDLMVKAIAKTVGEATKARVAPVPLDAARALVGLVMGLPGWTKRTAQVGQRAQDVRAMLLKASDPHRVLFTALPALLQDSNPQQLVESLRDVTIELSSAYERMLRQVEAAVFDALDHAGRRLEELHTRAANAKGITGDFRVDAFAARLEVYDSSKESIEGLISLAVSKPSANWVDRDIDAALLQLGAWALEFRKAEAMAPLRGRPATRRIIGVVFGARHGRDACASIDVAEADGAVVDDLVKRVLATVQTERSEIVLAALAEAGALLMRQPRKEAA
jgi:hypothetical protein